MVSFPLVMTRIVLSLFALFRGKGSVAVEAVPLDGADRRAEIVLVSLVLLRFLVARGFGVGFAAKKLLLFLLFLLGRTPRVEIEIEIEIGIEIEIDIDMRT